MVKKVLGKFTLFKHVLYGNVCTILSEVFVEVKRRVGSSGVYNQEFYLQEGGYEDQM